MPVTVTDREGDREARRRLAGAGAVGALVLGAFAGVLSSGADAVTVHVADLGTTIAAFVAAALCARAGQRECGRMRWFWWLLASACSAWTLGEAVWAVDELVLRQEVPVPSWADVGYLAAVPLAASALLVHPSMGDRRVGAARSALDGFIVATALLFVSWSFVLGPVWRTTDAGTLATIVALAYPFGDVILVWFVVLLTRRMAGTDRHTLWLLLAGMVAMAFADSAYAYLTTVRSYEPGALIDVGWVAAYLAIAIAAFASRPAPRTAAPAPPPVTLAPVVVGFVPMLAALGAVAVDGPGGPRGDAVSSVAAFALVCLVLVRQALVVIDLRSARAGGSRVERLDSAIAGARRVDAGDLARRGTGAVG